MFITRFLANRLSIDMVYDSPEEQEFFEDVKRGQPICIHRKVTVDGEDVKKGHFELMEEKEIRTTEGAPAQLKEGEDLHGRVVGEKKKELE